MRTPARNLLTAVALVGLCASPATAALITDTDPTPDLVLDTNPTLIYGQTIASPCVIGGSNCQNPVGFAYTLVGPGGNGETSIVPSASYPTTPTYTTAQILGVTGNSTAFTIGLDYNQSNDAQTLNYFGAYYFDVNGNPVSSQVFDIATLLQTNNNGVGFSDFLLSGFLIPATATTVQFQASWFNNDGADRYFIIGANVPPCTENCGGTPTPEPASLALFGLAAGAAAMARRRKKQ